MIGAIILAAGGSSRLGSAKQLLQFEGKTLLRRATESALEAGCDPVVVVVGARRDEVSAEVSSLQVLVAPNEDWSVGLSASVRIGIESLRQTEARAAILLPCDQPLLNADLLSQLMREHDAGASIVVCEYAGTWGAPMLFSRDLWPELQVLEGDRGAQKVARAHTDLVRRVAFDGGAQDIDTNDDYQKFIASRL